MTFEDQKASRAAVAPKARKSISKNVSIGAAIAVATILGTTPVHASPLAPAVTASALSTEVSTSAVKPEVIPADGIASGEIKTSGDLQSVKTGKYTISGHAWLSTTGSPSTTQNGLEAVPSGTKVYAQWKDSDGSISPIYSAATHDTVTGEQGGPGTYAFKFPSWTDSTGKHHYFTASRKQEYKLWVEPLKNPDTGGELTMLRIADGFFPGRFVDTGTRDGSLGAVTVQ
ncbi:hypothetical protein [Glutamicibacter protophormiae]|uniref:hypothetical protein n=1 Tax=Glutamicibacter protophormiae TaxID=37930 RepID=UPI00195CA205|nr:hypothetical protein [Glutamicibacter protophormiae]QRQ77348.1 hypothetical protein JQN66_10360 [Glutamicibacter protophormiae]